MLPTMVKIHALSGLISRARDEIAWARQGLALCDEIEARRASRSKTARSG